jgi:hypothetical protein
MGHRQTPSPTTTLHHRRLATTNPHPQLNRYENSMPLNQRPCSGRR